MGENMISAYILITIEPGTTNKAILEMKKIENVVKISVVAGEYDVVARVQVKTLEKLLDVTNKIQMIKGVKKTTTQVIEKELTL
jgi:DNA-binding Lrp family transcriptional regulator